MSGCDSGFHVRGLLGQTIGHHRQRLTTTPSFRTFGIDSLLIDRRQRIDVMKIDAEMSDFAVLAGSVDMIRHRRIGTIFMEVHRVEMHRYLKPKNIDVVMALFRSGYRATFIGDVDCGNATSQTQFWDILRRLDRTCVDAVFYS